MSRTLAFFPDWRAGNPYQDLLYADLDRIDVEPVPVRELMSHLGSADGGVLHLHWTTPILAKAETEGEARAVVAALATALDGFASRGGRLMWSVHNVLPHESRFHEEEVALAQLVADRADVVHVLSPVTAAAVAPYYRLDPAKVAVVAHSSYRGCYPDRVNRERARDKLGIPRGDTVLLAFGQIRPYKGLDRLLDAFDAMVLDDPSLRLLVVGRPGRDSRVPTLVERLRNTPRVECRFHRIPDHRVQVWHRAADLAVTSYAGILNSGSFLLAESFDLPVVAPRAGALVERDGEAHVRLYDPGDLEPVLRRAVSDLVHDRQGAARAQASARSASRARSPRRMAREFADLVGPLFTQA